MRAARPFPAAVPRRERGPTLDIATKVISPETAVWGVFPGHQRRFVQAFRESKAVFLETPGINLRPAVLQDDALLRQHLAMSVAIAAYRGQGNSPSRNPRAYDVRHTQSMSKFVGYVRTLFVEAKQDDLVVTSHASMYEPPLIGEIVSPFNPEHLLSHPMYGSERIPYREVRWLPVRRERRQLSQALSLLLSNKNAVISLSKERFGDEILTAAYGDYVFNKESRYVFSGETYNNIALATVPAIQLISYFAAAFNAADAGHLDEFKSMGIEQAIDKYFEGDILKSFEINFSSPGNFVLHARRAALPLLVAVFIAATAGTMSYDQARIARIENSLHQAAAAPGTTRPQDQCTTEVAEKYKAVMESMSADQWAVVCRKNQEAKDGVGLSVRVRQGHSR